MVLGNTGGQTEVTPIASEDPTENEQATTARPAGDSRHLPECNFCGASLVESQPDEDLKRLDVKVEKYVCSYQAAAKTTTEMIEQMVVKLNESRGNLNEQQGEIDAHNKDIQSERLELEKRQRSLQEREKKLDMDIKGPQDDLEMREKLLVKREELLEEMVKDLRAKESAAIELQNTVNSRSISLTEREVSLARDIIRREEELTIRENHTNSLLKAAKEKNMSMVELQEKLAEKETTFKDLELATIEELDGKEAVLEKRECTVAKKNAELQMQRSEIESLRQEIQTKEEHFVQWERLSKYDIAKCQESLGEKEQQLSIQVQKIGLKEVELNNQTNDFQKRETDFKRFEADKLQDIERREAIAADQAQALRRREESLAVKEKKILAFSEDVRMREESFRSEYSLWKIGIDRREKAASVKQQELKEALSSRCEKQDALHMAQKEIESRRDMIAAEEREAKQKINSEKITVDELSVQLKKSEGWLVSWKEELVLKENDITKREAHILEERAKVDRELQSREAEMRKLKEKWMGIERDYNSKLEALSKREADLLNRREAHMSRRELNSKNLSLGLQKKEEEINVLKMQLSTRTAEHGESVAAKTEEITRRRKKLSVMEDNTIWLIKRLEEREELLARDEIELKERLRNIEVQESRLSGLMDKEKQLAEHEDLVKMREREISNRSQQLLNHETSLKKLEAASDIQLKMLDERETKLANEKNVLNRKIDKHTIHLQAYSEEMKRTRWQISKREKTISTRHEDISARETSLASKSSEVEKRVDNLKNLEQRLHNLDFVLTEKENSLQESKRDLVTRQDKDLSRQAALSADLDKRENAVATSKAAFSKMMLKIEEAEVKVTREKEFIQHSRTKIQSLQQQVLLKDRQIRDLEEEIYQVEADLGKYFSMNSEAIRFLRRRRLSEGVAGSEPRSLAGTDIPLTRNLEQSSYMWSTQKADFSSRLDESAALTYPERTKQQSTRVDNVDEQRGGWYGHARNVLFGWKSTAAKAGKPVRAERMQDADYPVLDGSYNGVTANSPDPRLGRRSNPGVGASRKRSSGSGGLGTTPEKAPVEKQMRLEPQ